MLRLGATLRTVAARGQAAPVLARPVKGQAMNKQRERNFLVTVAMYFSMALSVFVAVIVLTGMVAYFLKMFFHIDPKWLFGLFD